MPRVEKILFILFSLVCLLVLVFWGDVAAPVARESEAPLSEQTEECLECHRVYTPGIVEDWKASEHAHGIPAVSMKKPRLEREVSSPAVPENLLHVAVGCFECHSLNAANHTDNFEHFDRRINIVVSPNDCATWNPTFRPGMSTERANMGMCSTPNNLNGIGTAFPGSSEKILRLPPVRSVITPFWSIRRAMLWPREVMILVPDFGSEYSGLSIPIRSRKAARPSSSKTKTASLSPQLFMGKRPRNFY